jgi:flagellar basal-body rod protein FlgB
MASTLDSYLGIHTQALALEAQRTDVLAANLANADTPNYKARDLDFKSALAAAAGAQGAGAPAAGTAGAAGALTGAPLTLAITDPADLTTAGTEAGAAAGSSAATAGVAGTAGADDQAFLKYRVPLAPSLDGNTVDEQLEESAFAENTVRYQATLTFLNIKLRDLLTAIGSQ